MFCIYAYMAVGFFISLLGSYVKSMLILKKIYTICNCLSVCCSLVVFLIGCVNRWSLAGRLCALEPANKELGSGLNVILILICIDIALTSLCCCFFDFKLLNSKSETA